ncbi:uncharacterized protein LOC112539783 [Tetranychus urticae]|uniref:uncharacterized protein LOC112539783 n=1 Tax=Tetranychus urticae TaxID=32264 RepID=UPI000D651848|nr:uncharacterized protein LOC112539783 [Tetranychus urticae]
MDLLNSSYFICFYIILNVAKEVWSLEITQFVVPKLAVVGKSYELKCSIRANEGKLAIIKWYRNDSEIYRVQIKPAKTKIFPAVGININVSKTHSAFVTNPSN